MINLNICKGFRGVSDNYLSGYNLARLREYSFNQSTSFLPESPTILYNGF